MAFCDCACHFRLGIWNFDPILLVGMPGIGGGERSDGGETPPGASVRRQRNGEIMSHYVTLYHGVALDSDDFYGQRKTTICAGRKCIASLKVSCPSLTGLGEGKSLGIFPRRRL